VLTVSNLDGCDGGNGGGGDFVVGTILFILAPIPPSFEITDTRF